jgi:glutamate/tyrosine decarboxylase-like PLP-dependent enzyme
VSGSADVSVRVVAFVPDLMDRSKVKARFPEAELVASPVALVEAIGRLDPGDRAVGLVIVDLGRAGVIDALGALGDTGGAHLVGFASHVDEATLDAARTAGVEALARSVFFRRLAQGELVGRSVPSTPSAEPSQRIDVDSMGPQRFDVDSMGPQRFDVDSMGPQRFDVDSTGPQRFDVDSAPTEPSTELRELLADTAALAVQHLAALPGRSVDATVPLDELRRRLGGRLPDDATDARRTVEELAAGTEGGLVASNGPRYFGFVTGGSLPAALAADWLTSAWDQNVALGVMSPAAAVAEEVVGGWLVDLLCLPPTVSFGLVTGAQMANVVGLAAARHHVLARLGVDVGRVGLAGAPPLRVVVGAERHVTVDVALRYLGIGSDQVTIVPADRQGRLRPDALGEALDRLGQGATIVCAQAGCVNTGAFDPFAEIVALAHGAERWAWVHVDGAFGLWAAASPRLRPLTAGVAAADSWATDGHKWLNVPYDTGFAFVAHPDDHRSSLAMQAAYLQRGSDSLRDGSDWAPESSRRARAFPTWAALRSLGRRGVADLVERDCRLAARLAGGLEALPGVEVLNDVVLNQLLVSFGDERTDSVIAAVQASGIAWFGGTTWGGRPAARISVSSWSTGEADVDRVVAAIGEAIRAPTAGPAPNRDHEPPARTPPLRWRGG